MRIDGSRSILVTRCAGAGIVAALALGAVVGARAADTEPPFEELLELNGQALFGGDVKAEKGRMTIRFDTGQFDRGFTTSTRRGRFVFDPGRIVSQRNKEWAKGAEKELAMVGIQEGRAVSRFELADDYAISFRVKIPELSNRSVFGVVLNQRGRAQIQTSFFSEIVALDGRGGKRRQKASDERFRAPPLKWFVRDSKEGVPFQIVFKGGKLTILTGKKKDDKDDKKEEGQVEIVSMTDIVTPTSGKLSFVFGNLDFVLMRDLRIEAAIPRAWADEEIGRLRRAGALLTKDAARREKADRDLAQGPNARAAKRGSDNASDRKRDWDKEVEVDIDKDDPEIDEDL